MRTLGELREKLTPYQGVDYIYQANLGYIAWREGTGNNLEMLFIEAAEKGRGYGRELYKLMVKQVRCPPYHSVFGFILGSNYSAIHFYTKLGCTVTDIGNSVYKNDRTSLMWIRWADLLKNLEKP